MSVAQALPSSSAALTATTTSSTSTMQPPIIQSNNSHHHGSVGSNQQPPSSSVMPVSPRSASTPPTGIPQQYHHHEGMMPRKSYCCEDFELGEQIGEGAYSRVVLATFKPTGKQYALKIIKKQLILKENKTKTVKMEKQVLNMMDHDNVIKLFCTFQDANNLYFALEYAPGGELYSYIKNYGPFSLEATQFYTAEIVNAMEYMHTLGIIHRDLKDFGTAKITAEEEVTVGESPLKAKKGTFCGTVQYVSPEILKDEDCTEAADLWALGCIVYQMLTATHPFKAESEYLIFQKILKREFEFTDDFPYVARDFVDKLLQLDAPKRLGVGPYGYKELKAHPFFDGIDFNNLKNQTPPSIVPFADLNAIELEDKQDDFDEPNPYIVEKLNEKWSLFLLKNESIVYTRKVVKRRRLTAKKRQLILTDWPRLMYIDYENMVVKGFVPLSKTLKIIKKSDNNMILRTPGRDYIIEDVKGCVDRWSYWIEKMISEKLGTN
ncbi:hypothetical protein C9374_003318 [Naegleria lovaniensis]|uniref:non-specific serine/threonine protein kinase n=1 Tax=Naegleria lovaniensis TaxID=51637 RepID=A0AA88GSL1_NAELO|nr:uncharacterized protein C9374_003318 [Naegleria lovaniensis]KAG2385503.1 hypothetical protein C9374_003318 [Naegleria lovaniensis]